MGNGASLTNNSVLLSPDRFEGTWYTIAAYGLTEAEQFTYIWDCTSATFTVTRSSAGQSQRFNARFGSQSEDILILSPTYGDGEFTEVVLYTDYTVWAVVSNQSRTKYRVMSRNASICRSEKGTIVAATRALGFDPSQLIAPRSVMDDCITVEQTSPAATAVVTTDGAYVVRNPLGLEAPLPVATGAIGTYPARVSPGVVAVAPQYAAPVAPQQVAPVAAVSTAVPTMPVSGPIPVGARLLPIVPTTTTVVQPSVRTTYRSPPVLGQVPIHDLDHDGVACKLRPPVLSPTGQPLTRAGMPIEPTAEPVPAPAPAPARAAVARGRRGGAALVPPRV